MINPDQNGNTPTEAQSAGQEFPKMSQTLNPKKPSGEPLNISSTNCSTAVPCRHLIETAARTKESGGTWNGQVVPTPGRIRMEWGSVSGLCGMLIDVEIQSWDHRVMEKRTDRYHSTFCLREDTTGILPTDLAEIHFIELPKLRERSVELERRPVRWMLFLRAKTKEQLEGFTKSVKPGCASPAPTSAVPRGRSCIKVGWLPRWILPKGERGFIEGMNFFLQAHLPGNGPVSAMPCSKSFATSHVILNY